MQARAAGVAVVLAVAAGAWNARAEPQANVAATVGLAGRGSGEVWEETRLHLGARSDVLFGRSRNLDVGWGPYVEGMTSLDDVSVGAGVSVLLPVHAYLPVVTSGGGYGWNGPDGGWEPGVSGQVFWGSRSFNYHSWYVMAGGISVQGRVGLGDTKERTVIVAAHLDGEILALPVLLLIGSLGGSGSE